MKLEKIKNLHLYYIMPAPYTDIVKTTDNKFYVEIDENDFRRMNRKQGEKLAKKSTGQKGLFKMK